MKNGINRLLNDIMQTLGLKNDTALARALEVAPPVISKLRGRTINLGATHILRIHDLTDWSIRPIKMVLGEVVTPAQCRENVIARHQAAATRYLDAV